MPQLINVKKRDGSLEPFDRQKLRLYLERLTDGLDTRHVLVDTVVSRTMEGIYDGIDSRQLDNLVAETAAYLSVRHPDYSYLAGRAKIKSLHKDTSDSFSELVQQLHSYVHPKTGQCASLIADDVFESVMRHRERLDSAIQYERDLLYDYFGFKTLERSYLLRMNGEIAERPQHMLLRVAVGIHKDDIDAAVETYDLLSRGLFTHASPTLFNAGTPMPQMSSCFLVAMKEDSIDGIYDTLKTCALISKCAGGIGLHVHNIRASGSYIRGTNGHSNGLVPMLRVFNDTARYVDQGGGKRKGAFAIYLEPWHADIFQFLELRKNHGIEEQRARDLFYALWVSDLFMERVEKNGDWSLFCPNEAPGLADVWGEEFEALYTRYEREGRAMKVVKAQELWFAIVDAQTETGTPFMLYKDSANRKSNHQNLGTIKSSNLCTEIIQYTDKDEVAVCNLASLALPKYIAKNPETGELFFDHDSLCKVVQVVTRNLNKIIDLNYYPVPEAERSNKRHRPIGIGVQGLADTFITLKMPFESEEARRLNLEIFETIYFGAMTASKDIAKVHGPYETYSGSPVSKGILQYDMWGVTPTDKWDWATLKREIAEHGVRNSLLIAPMPTASTSQILGNNEATEPYTSNLYVRSVLSGSFPVVNRHLVRDLVDRKIWSDALINKLIAANGSVQNLAEIPDDLKELYKTAWEIKQRTLLDMAADRGAFIDQSQSLNVFMAEPTTAKLTSMHFYAWKRGLKTGMYYMRSQPAADAIQFTVDMESLRENATQESAAPSEGDPVVCVRRPKGLSADDECLACGS